MAAATIVLIVMVVVVMVAVGNFTIEAMRFGNPGTYQGLPAANCGAAKRAQSHS